MRTLVTGGTGYVGSHTCVDLLLRGHEVVIYDNLSNSSRDAVEAITFISGSAPAFHQGDVRDQSRLASLLAEYNIEAVLHFAALKSVGESWDRPLEYYDNNVTGTLSLLRAMASTGTDLMVFSSSATVYGEPERCPIREDAVRTATNPYGRTKLMAEDIIADTSRARDSFKYAILRYFNPVGAHASGRMGEAPSGTPDNLMPYVAQVAAGERDFVRVFGADYPTHDGTGVRDYVHIADLARAHVDALDYLAAQRASLTVNLGTGRGHSVLEVIEAFERASGRKIERRVVGRRAGDVATCFADPSLARALLGWSAGFDLDRMCQDAWRWQSRSAPVASSPNGSKPGDPVPQSS